MPSELLKDIERAAYTGKNPPEDLEPPEMMLYYMLLGLYSNYKLKHFSIQEGEAHKQRIYNIYNRYLSEYKQFTEICKEYQRQIRERTMNHENKKLH